MIIYEFTMHITSIPFIKALQMCVWYEVFFFIPSFIQCKMRTHIEAVIPFQCPKDSEETQRINEQLKRGQGQSCDKLAPHPLSSLFPSSPWGLEIRGGSWTELIPSLTALNWSVFYNSRTISISLLTCTRLSFYVGTY